MLWQKIQWITVGGVTRFRTVVISIQSGYCFFFIDFPPFIQASTGESSTKRNGCFFLPGLPVKSSVFMRHNAVQSGESLPLFRLLAACFTLDSCLACPLTLKKEAMFYSEPSAGFHRNARRYFPEDIRIHRCKNLRSNVAWWAFYFCSNSPHISSW